VSPAAAVAELRRKAGSQFDPEVIEVFTRVLESQQLSFGHADDVDFEAELAFEHRVRHIARA